MKVLDIGCGPADILEYLSGVDYLGYDMNPRYIKKAQKRFGDRGIFLCRKIGKEALQELLAFDLVMANAVLHHLTDAEAKELFVLARSVLKPLGRLVTIDGCFVEGQSRIVRLLLFWDRGRFVRTREQYLKLARAVFPRVKYTIRHDLARVHYTHIIMECAA